jgi:hypothetical protein
VTWPFPGVAVTPVGAAGAELLPHPDRNIELNKRQMITEEHTLNTFIQQLPPFLILANRAALLMFAVLQVSSR